jgi:Sec-independent protein translocase protein TatA
MDTIQTINFWPLIILALAVVAVFIFRKQLGALLGQLKDLIITARDRTVKQVFDKEVKNDSNKKADPSISDIFISYKREEQAIARKLADALESEGWTVWWDPKLRAGERFDEVIEKALNEAKCVVVLWSNLSVNSDYVKAEAIEALEQKKLVPIKIESVNLPFRFRSIHTPSLLGWNGSKHSPAFRKLVDDISSLLGKSPTAAAEVARYSEEVRKKEPTSTEFLAQLINRETMSAYTRWKYPNLPVKEDLQELLIRDLDHSRYRTLNDMEEVIVGAIDAVEVYSKEAPNLFSFGTDFITKSMGFVDEHFRQAHKFGTQTREAFQRLSHLVRKH